MPPSIGPMLFGRLGGADGARTLILRLYSISMVQRAQIVQANLPQREPLFRPCFSIARCAKLAIDGCRPGVTRMPTSSDTNRAHGDLLLELEEAKAACQSALARVDHERRLNEELEEAVRNRDAVLSVVAHDL